MEQTSITSFFDSDTNYVQTGIYDIVDLKSGIVKPMEFSTLKYALSREPLVSVVNIEEVSFVMAEEAPDGLNTMVLKFDSIGTEALKRITGNPDYPELGWVLANKLVYVVINKANITTGILNIFLDDYSEEELRTMVEAIRNKM